LDKESSSSLWLHLVKVLLDYISKPDANPSLASLSLKLIQQNIAGEMTPEECSVFFQYII
jgi:hypothetical protein